MTGFGRGEEEANGMVIRAEARSLNHRFLEINVRLPREYGFLEDTVRRQIQGGFSRGRFDILIDLDIPGQSKKVIVDKPLAMAYYRALEEIKQELNEKMMEPVAMYVASLPGVLDVEEEAPDEEFLKALLERALGQALGQVAAMRATEGEAIARYLENSVAALEGLLRKVIARNPEVVAEYRARIERRLQEILPEGNVDQTRLTMEVATMAERADVGEEISRALSHIAQFRTSLEGEGGAVGRKLEFILQEMHREVNTLGSKAQDFAIANGVVEAKAELEKMREQAQNVE